MNEKIAFGALLDVIPFATYAVDIETYQVVYINKRLYKLFTLYIPYYYDSYSDFNGFDLKKNHIH